MVERMEYSITAAQPFIGKRVIVSLRHFHPERPPTFSGFWGVIESIHEDCLLLRIEGGMDESHWAMPPELDALQPAKHDHYEFGDNGTFVSDVDFEAYYSVASSPELLRERD
jgi:hypothetical protein